MSDFQNYMLQQARKEAAMARYNYAGADLSKAQIMERLAEIKSQHEPLATLVSTVGDGNMAMRDALYAAAFYVAVGRMPDNGV